MIEFANNDLGKIKVEHLHTGLSREVAKSSNETLFLWESSNLLRSTQQKHENTSMGLEGLLNVFRVRTTWTPAPTIDSHFMQDSELGEE